MTGRHFSPREFLKNRRPERFSDSAGYESPTLDRSQLEFHLNTLTSRNEEVLFEHFARRLLERTICPNLLPHTGPTGGGDSKVDTETYPVAETLAMGWHVGIGNEAATERWGFAISAKADWKTKLKSDIAKIAATGRGYTKAFFVTNQSVPDRERAEVEDGLRNQHELDVRIFDRTWILDKIFEQHFEELAIQELRISTSARRQVQKGPLDTGREQDLQEIETRITTALEERRYVSSLVDDCLEAANLARSLERPRAEVEGFYDRADRLANQFGTPHQRLQSIYNRMWTVFWWYEDYRLFVTLYAQMEERARGSRNAYDLELWTNLFFLLRQAVICGEMKTKGEVLHDKAMALLAELDRLALEKERPSTALQARTLGLLAKLGLALTQTDGTDSILRELTVVIGESESLIGYPLEPLVQIVTELGNALGNRQAYDEVFQTAVQTSGRRNGEVSAARMLLTRGAQQLESEHPYEAIRTLGSVLGRLYKHESRGDLVRALYLCARAYENVGLLWAARGTMLAAASIATSEFWTHEKTTPQQAICYNRIKWIELRLGRLPYVLTWHEVDQALRASLVARGYTMNRLFEHNQTFDAILGILLLKTDVWELRELTTLPDVLDVLDLPLASVALLYALGHEDQVPEELLGTQSDVEAKRNLFRRWRDQPAAKHLLGRPLLYLQQTIALTSTILGCRITVDCWNQSPCIELAESLLAAIESFLSTGTLERVVAHEPTLTIRIRPSDLGDAPFTFDVRDNVGRPRIEIHCRNFSPHKLSLEDQAQFKQRLFELVAQVIARVFIMSNWKDTLTKLFRDERVSQRALDFTASFVVVGNVLGHEPKTTLASWCPGNARAYPLTRVVAWDHEDGGKELTPGNIKQATSVGLNVQPAGEFRNPKTVTHNQMQTISLIRESFWNEASWSATAFATLPNHDAPPILVLAFKNIVPAAKIFELWHSELGSADEANKLHVAIVRRIDKRNPHAYRVLIGSNPNGELTRSGIARVVLVSRVNTMGPSTSENLDRFLTGYEIHKGYTLGYGVLSANQQVVIANSHQLFKKGIIVREAWEIGPDDLDAAAIREDDDPIIPDGQRDAPVLKTLERWRRHAAAPG